MNEHTNLREPPLAVSAKSSAQAATGWPLTPLLPESDINESLATQREEESTTEHSDDPYTWVPLMEPAWEDSDGVRLTHRLIWQGQIAYLIAFTSMEAARLFGGDDNFPRLKQSMSSTISMLTEVMQADERIAGIVFDPAGPQPYLREREDLLQTRIRSEVTKSEDILRVGPLGEAASPAILDALARVLRASGIAEARGVFITYTDLRETWLIGIPTSDSETISTVWYNMARELRRFVVSDDTVPDVALCDLRESKITTELGEPLL